MAEPATAQQPQTVRRRRRIRSATRFSSAWTQSWQGLQMGERLQADAITERQIEMIALGGVIGTGLFLGTATALHHSGPLGALIGYIITGTIVLSVTKSLAHIVSCFPRSGGPVGLSHLYVDPALAFALGWNAWYNWTIILPSEIAAATLLMNTYISSRWWNIGWTTGFIIAVLGVNFMGARYYGRMETVFSIIKISAIMVVLASGIVLACINLPEKSVLREGSTSDMRIGFRWWYNPGPLRQYRRSDNLGRFFGIWAVLLQACFSYFGTEVTAMAAAEVRNPRVSIRNAARNTWIRISVFYVGAVFVAGLLVPYCYPPLSPTSPDEVHKYKPTWPQVCLNETLFNLNPSGKNATVFSSPFVIGFQFHDTKTGAYILAGLFVFSAFSAAVSDVFISSRLFFFMSKCGHAPRWGSRTWKITLGDFPLGIIPYNGVLLVGAFGTLAYLNAANAEQTFHWLSTMTSTACLCSWIGMMWTYINWDRGLKRARRRALAGEEFYVDFFRKYKDRIPERVWYRTLRAWYAFIMCILILLFNGWAVFTVPGQWIVATIPGHTSTPPTDPDIGDPVQTFITSYLPVPMFLLLIFGYKLTSRTQTVSTHDMVMNMQLEWDAAAQEDATVIDSAPLTSMRSRFRQNVVQRFNPVEIVKLVAWSMYGIVFGRDTPAPRGRPARSF